MNRQEQLREIQAKYGLSEETAFFELLELERNDPETWAAFKKDLSQLIGFDLDDDGRFVRQLLDDPEIQRAIEESVKKELGLEQFLNKNEDQLFKVAEKQMSFQDDSRNHYYNGRKPLAESLTKRDMSAGLWNKPGAKSESGEMLGASLHLRPILLCIHAVLLLDEFFNP